MKKPVTPPPVSVAVRIGGPAYIVAVREAVQRRITVKALVESVLVAVDARMTGDPLAACTFPALTPWGATHEASSVPSPTKTRKGKAKGAAK